MDNSVQKGFRDFGLSDSILRALDQLGYEIPTPIQSATIPPLLERRDLLGQAQTGTGKTAAFALPLLTNLDLNRNAPQVMVLAPTRELAIQVAEAFHRYAEGLKNFRVVTIYGGQSIVPQLKQLQRGVHVVVGTPGRLMDHMRRGTLKLDHLSSLVLDEADEMLKMGFIEDIEWILSEAPPASQKALFSATLPPPIRKIARTYLKNPVEITIEQTKANSPMIRQRYWMVDGLHKANAMTRILEAEAVDGILVFVRTKTMTTELAMKLEAQGFAASSLSGDMSQAAREEAVERFKSGKIDIVVATDVAARGLDIDRISHVINYDMPHNVEAYIHRIGRTGRAGRSGEAILFVSPRERGLLNAIKRMTGGKMEMMALPTAKTVHDARVERFKQSITETLAGEGLAFYRELLESYSREKNVPALDIAAALAARIHAEKPLQIPRGPVEQPRPPKHAHHRQEFTSRPPREREEFSARPPRHKNAPAGASKSLAPIHEGKYVPPPAAGFKKEKHRKGKKDRGIRMEQYRIDVGRRDGVQPGELAHLISEEAGLDRKYIGTISISENETFIELPQGMPPGVCRELRNLPIAGKISNFAPVKSRGHHHPPKKNHR